jgi:sulfatase modifying factor 1
MKNTSLTLLLLVAFFSSGYSQRPAEPEMVLVEGGNFNMGSDRNPDERPVHRVTVSSFRMAKYEVTVAEYKAYVAATGRSMPITAPPWGWIDSHPMTLVNWTEASAYCDWLTDKSGKLYRLPTEAEWEYAARGGKKSKNTMYSGAANPEGIAWYDAQGLGTKPVGQKQPNELGLYDMSGNVFEWCSDWYGMYTAGPAIDPRGPLNGLSRVMRGGSWLVPASFATVTHRYNLNPSLPHRINGFRLVSTE